MTILLAAATTYLWASLPLSYLIALHWKGIDLRRFGSGNVGSANIIEQFGIGTGILCGAFDCLIKGTLPIFVARLFGQDVSVQVACGLSSIIGHNWSLYIRFTGGRGIATAVGVLIGFYFWVEIAVLCFSMLIGRRVFRETALCSLLGLLMIPGVHFLRTDSLEGVYFFVAIVMLLILKRFTANWESPSKNKSSLLRVIGRRILWDRDVSRNESWTDRRPVIISEDD